LGVLGTGKIRDSKRLSEPQSRNKAPPPLLPTIIVRGDMSRPVTTSIFGSLTLPTIKSLNGRYALKSRSQRTIKAVGTMNQLISGPSLALDDFHRRDGVVKPEAAQNSQDSFAG